MIVDLWNLTTNTGALGVEMPDFDALEAATPLAIIGWIGDARYLVNPAWPCDDAGAKLLPSRVTLADDGLSLRVQTAEDGVLADPAPDDL